MTASVLIRNVLAILVMTIVAIAPAHAASECYDKADKCDLYFVDKDLKRTTDPKLTDIRCNPYAAQSGAEFLKDESTTALPAYKRLSQCAAIEDYDSRTRTFKPRTQLGTDLLGNPAQVPVPCGKYYKGDDCTKKDL